MSTLDSVILHNLQYNEDYARRVIPFLKDDYFFELKDRTYFSKLNDFFLKYNKLPDKDALLIDVQNTKMDEETYKSVTQMVDHFALKGKPQTDTQWLVDQTEEFCKNKSLWLGMQEAIAILKGADNNNLAKTAIPDILSKALAVSFDTNVGHDYVYDADKRFEFYHNKPDKVKFHLETLNKITNGGYEKGTLNAVMAGTNVGKSIWLCDIAANALRDGKNVLYISLEMAEMKIAQRIDANLMNIDINEVDKMPKDLWDAKIAKFKDSWKSKLKFKQYPTSSAGANHFRFLLRELKQKQNFVPDIIIIDYLNITAAAKHKDRADSYGYLKCVSEEMRALGIEYNCPVWTGLQFNRSGNKNSDADMTNAGESFAIVHTLDFLLLMIVTEELINIGQVMFVQDKSRYGDVNNPKKFMVGLDRMKMRFYDLDNASIATGPQKTPPIKQSNFGKPNVNKNNFLGVKE